MLLALMYRCAAAGSLCGADAAEQASPSLCSLRGRMQSSIGLLGRLKAYSEYNDLDRYTVRLARARKAGRQAHFSAS